MIEWREIDAERAKRQGWQLVAKPSDSDDHVCYTIQPAYPWPDRHAEIIGVHLLALHGDGPSMKTARRAISILRDSGSTDAEYFAGVAELEEPDGCECDKTHAMNDTVCRWCFNRGRRCWDDPAVPGSEPPRRTPHWRVEVTEVLHERRIYVVEAETADAAVEMAERGETIDESDVKQQEVFGRTCHSETLQQLPEDQYI